MSLRSKPLESFVFRVITVRLWLAARRARASPLQPSSIERLRAWANREPASAASGVWQEQTDLEANEIASGLERTDKINACLPTADLPAR